jgi:flagellar basal-body rod modification protein FlgD
MSTSVTSATSRTTVNKDEFLQLLVAQLRHQDPTNPMDSQDFAAQLAQFSSLEQLTQLNDAMTTQIQASQENSLVAQTTFSATLMGKTVIASGDQVSIPTSGSGKIHVTVGAGGGTAKLTLLDSDGNKVATRDLGTVAGGDQTITLPSDLPGGDYHYTLEVTDLKGKSVAVETYTTGIVSGVVFSSGSILLRLGTLEVKLDDVTELAPGSSNGTTTTGNTASATASAKALLGRLGALALGRP